MPINSRDLREGDKIQFVHRGSLVVDVVRKIHRGRASIRLYFRSGLEKIFPSSSTFEEAPSAPAPRQEDQDAEVFGVQGSEEEQARRYVHALRRYRSRDRLAMRLRRKH